MGTDVSAMTDQNDVHLGSAGQIEDAVDEIFSVQHEYTCLY